MSSNIYYKLITPFKSKEHNKYNYVYQITEISTGQKYIGSRGSMIEPNKDIKKYKSSSKDKQFKLNQKLNPLNYWYEILSYHATREDATLEEARLHELYNVGCNNSYFNRSKQTKNGFSIAGKAMVVDTNGKTMQVSVDDDRFLSGDLKHINLGKITVKDKNGKTMQVSKTDERYLNGDLKHIASGTVPVTDKNGVVIRVSVNDERYVNGDLKHITSGKVVVRDKNGVAMQVSKTDERYMNGDLKHITSGKITVKNKFGVTMHVSKTDERFLNGDLIGVASGMVPVKNKFGVTMQVSKTDERFLNGDLIGVKAKWFNINDEVISIKNAAEKYKVHLHTVRNRVKSTNPKWSEWKYA